MESAGSETTAEGGTPRLPAVRRGERATQVEMETIPLTTADAPDHENCLTLMLDGAVMRQILPDGRKVSEVLPNDGQKRAIQGSCPRPGCPSTGTVVCQGSVAIASRSEGHCTRPDLQDLRQG